MRGDLEGARKNWKKTPFLGNTIIVLELEGEGPIEPDQLESTFFYTDSIDTVIINTSGHMILKLL